MFCGFGDTQLQGNGVASADDDDDESYDNSVALHRNCIRLEQCSSFSNLFFKTVFPKSNQDVGISGSSSLRCSLWQRVLLLAIATGARGHDTFFWN